jgi:hypothetical protein
VEFVAEKNPDLALPVNTPRGIRKNLLFMRAFYCIKYRQLTLEYGSPGSDLYILNEHSF